MTKRDFLKILAEIIDNSKIGVLAAVGADNSPSMRWMTPGLLKDREGAIYALTSKSFSKVSQLKKNRNVEWQIQTRALDKIATIKGEMNLIDNSSLKKEVIETIGVRLNVFWKVNNDPSSLIVLETVISEGRLFQPMKGLRDIVSFTEEDA